MAYLLSVIVGCLLILLHAPGVTAADSSEHQVKAAMTYNMLRFMDWPDDPQPQLRICLIGKGPLIAAMSSLQGKTVKGRSLSVVPSGSSPAALSGCDLLVLGELDRTAVNSILDRSRTASLVTISDSGNFVHSGGVIGFILQDGKVRFEINLAAAQRHRIRISSQLLKLAITVVEQP